MLSKHLAKHCMDSVTTYLMAQRCCIQIIIYSSFLLVALSLVILTSKKHCSLCISLGSLHSLIIDHELTFTNNKRIMKFLNPLYEHVYVLKILCKMRETDMVVGRMDSMEGISDFMLKCAEH